VTYILPVVDPNDLGGAEGVYTSINLSAANAPDYPFGLMLGYLVQTWARVNHCGPAQTHSIDLIEGDYTFTADSLEQKNGKEWRVSAVALDVYDYPAGRDMDFGDPKVIYAGKFSWLRNTVEADKEDWLPPTPPADLNYLVYNPMRGGVIGELTTPPPNATSGISLGVGFLAQGAYKGESYNIWSRDPDRITRNPFDPSSNAYSQPSFFVGGAVSLSFTKEEKPAAFAKPIAIRVSNEAQYQYPLQWVNFEKSWFDAPHPNVNGFTVKLKLGVKARAVVLLTVRDPYVIVTGGSFDGG
jgi:hypothetical protein